MGVFLTFAKWSLQIGGVNGSNGVRSRLLCVYVFRLCVSNTN